MLLSLQLLDANYVAFSSARIYLTSRASHSGSVGAGKGLPTIFFTGLREPTPPFALNFWRAGSGGFEFRGFRRLWRKLLRAFYI
jgi:hypothetical protein